MYNPVSNLLNKTDAALSLLATFLFGGTFFSGITYDSSISECKQMEKRILLFYTGTVLDVLSQHFTPALRVILCKFSFSGNFRYL